MIKSLKKNQVVIYVIALMLVAAGYLNYTADGTSILTSSDVEETYQENVASIGDATLVSSNYIEENETQVEEDISSGETENIASNELKTASSATDTSVDEDDYFAKSKLERDNMYSQMLETYQNIINSTTVSDEQRSIATQEITTINDTKNKIMICENLLETKGFASNIVFVNGSSVSVVVSVSGELTQEQVAQIQNVVSREMEVEIASINITQK